MLPFSLLLLSFSPPSQQLVEFGCLGTVDGSMGIKHATIWSDFGQKPSIFDRHLFANPLRYIII